MPQTQKSLGIPVICSRLGCDRKIARFAWRVSVSRPAIQTAKGGSAEAHSGSEIAVQWPTQSMAVFRTINPKPASLLWPDPDVMPHASERPRWGGLQPLVGSPMNDCGGWSAVIRRQCSACRLTNLARRRRVRSMAETSTGSPSPQPSPPLPME